MSGFRPPWEPPTPARWREDAGRVLAVGFLVSALLHAALLLAPPLQFGSPDHLSRDGRITVVPAPEEPPPEVEVPSTPRSVSPPPEPEVETGGGEPVPEEDTEPVFVPHDVPPRLLNSDEIQEYLQLFYPMALRLASVEGAVHLWLFVNEAGRATKLQIRESSGSEAFDRLARTAAPMMKFRPALNQGDQIGVWVSLWVRFNLEDPDLQGDENSRIAGEMSDGED